mmetsp:Transcript_9380/g.16313  ORF Transcript_9380/g.16313 Transcript_9380/m.16313 type:complete len:618 (-) Transcript_9380:26-1879(-)
MSQVYSTEPATTGRVVLTTTHGPIDIDLWCKECPTTTRTFLQLCLDGYYDGMIFHRILSEFLIQTGLTRDEHLGVGGGSKELNEYLRRSTAAPSSSTSSATSSGDALLFGLDRKKLELNPRIRFNHRGQVAMALPLDESSSSDDADEEDVAMLRYQFFVTLDEAPFLDAKHVVFGTIAGATMFNALRIGRTDADEQTGVPTDMTDCPPRITGVKVDYHPFDDLVVTADKKIPWKKDAVDKGSGGEKGGKEGKMEKRRKKRKGKRDLNVLSFGDEERDYEEITTKSSSTDKEGGSMLSSHDVLSSESKFLSSKVDADVDRRSKDKSKSKTERDEDGSSHKNENREKVMPAMESTSNKGGASESKESSDKVQAMHKNIQIEKNESINEQQSHSREDRNHKSERKSNKSKSISAVEARRAKYLKSGSGSSANKKERLKREGDTMAKLFAFKNKVIETKGTKKNGGDGIVEAKGRRPADDSLASRMAKRAKQMEDEEELRNKKEEAFVAMPGYSGQVDDDERHRDNTVATDAGDWMGTQFKCKRHMDHDSRRTALDNIGDDANDLGGDGRRMDDYVVLDEKRRGQRNGHGGHREHGRHNGSRHDKHHGERSRKSSGHHRSR